MKKKPWWILGLIGIVAVIAVPILIFGPRVSEAAQTDPKANLPAHPVHVDHKDIIKGPFDSPQAVTRACLACHADAAKDVMMTTHWTWESKPFTTTWRTEPVTIGKANQINNFCISAQGNQKSCTACHIGYDWKEGATVRDINDAEDVDCLI